MHQKGGVFQSNDDANASSCFFNDLLWTSVDRIGRRFGLQVCSDLLSERVGDRDRTGSFVQGSANMMADARQMKPPIGKVL